MYNCWFISPSKCQIMGLNYDHVKVSEWAKQVGCELQDFPTSYSGLPLGDNPRQISSWRPRGRGEKRRSFFSKGGKLTLIQSVLSGISIYLFFFLFQALCSMCKILEKLLSDFMWEGVEEGKGAHLVNREIIGKPIHLGGLKLENISIQGVIGK